LNKYSDNLTIINNLRLKKFLSSPSFRTETSKDQKNKKQQILPNITSTNNKQSTIEKATESKEKYRIA
jgi:hypothetical protein